jgi:hypothetical protein
LIVLSEAMAKAPRPDPRLRSTPVVPADVRRVREEVTVAYNTLGALAGDKKKVVGLLHG